MSKKKIVILVIVLIIFIGTGFLFLYKPNKNYFTKNYFTFMKKKIVSDINKQKREQLFLDLLKANSFEECDLVSMKIIDLGSICSGSECAEAERFYWEYITQCLGNIAARNNNYNLCKDNEILEEITKRIKELGQVTSGKNFLEEMCILSFMRNFKDKDKVDKSFELLCESLNGHSSGCFEYLATASKDYRYCPEDNFRCFHYFAFRNHDVKLCDYGKNEDWSKLCQDALSVLENNKVSVCKKIDRFYDTSGGTDGTGASGACYLGFAIYNHDLSLCENLKYKSDIGVCQRFSRE